LVLIGKKFVGLTEQKIARLSAKKQIARLIANKKVVGLIETKILLPKIAEPIPVSGATSKQSSLFLGWSEGLIRHESDESVKMMIVPVVVFLAMPYLAPHRPPHQPYWS
jgi:hypothetical protein